MPVPHFEAEGHNYTDGERELPSVTQVLEAEGFFPDYRWIEPWYMERGSAIHSAVALLCEGRLDWDSVSEAIRPFVEAAAAFLEFWKCTPLVVEQPLFDDIFGYAGTPDGVLHSERLGGLIVPDWKSTSYAPGYAVQLAGGYLPLLELAAKDGGIDVHSKHLRKCRLAIVPLSSKTPQPKWIADSPAERLQLRTIFRSAVASYNWKLEAGIHKPKS